MADTKRKLIKITTPKGVAKYPRLNTPDTKFNADGVFSVKVVNPKAEVQHIIDQINTVADEAFAEAKADIEQRLKDAKGEQKGKLKKELAELKKSDLPVKPVYDDDGNETDSVEITYKMNAKRKDKKSGKVFDMRPRFFDSKGKAIADDAVPSVWGGSVLKVSAQINPFYTAKAGAGASLRLSAVQIIELVTGGGGRAEDHGFGEEEGGFEAADAPAPKAKPQTDSDDDTSGAEDDGEF